MIRLKIISDWNEIVFEDDKDKDYKFFDLKGDVLKMVTVTKLVNKKSEGVSFSGRFSKS